MKYIVATVIVVAAVFIFSIVIGFIRRWRERRRWR